MSDSGGEVGAKGQRMTSCPFSGMPMPIQSNTGHRTRDRMVVRECQNVERWWLSMSYGLLMKVPVPVFKEHACIHVRVSARACETHTHRTRL